MIDHPDAVRPRGRWVDKPAAIGQLFSAAAEADRRVEEDEYARAIEILARKPTFRRFQRVYELDRPTGGRRCIGRLIEPSRGCRHPGGHDLDHPHKPPHCDHPVLWLRDGEPAAYGIHLYDNSRETLDDLFSFADEWNLEFQIEPVSWYNPGGCVHYLFTRP